MLPVPCAENKHYSTSE
nr:unnamed protein product [Callosobruchus chinensis]